MEEMMDRWNDVSHFGPGKASGADDFVIEYGTFVECAPGLYGAGRALGTGRAAPVGLGKADKEGVCGRGDGIGDD